MHVEDLKDPVEIRPPARGFFFVVHGMEMSKNRISFPLLDDFLLDLPHRPESKSSSMGYSKYSWLA